MYHILDLAVLVTGECFMDFSPDAHSFIKKLDNNPRTSKLVMATRGETTSGFMELKLSVLPVVLG